MHPLETVVIKPCSWSECREPLLKVRVEVFVDEQSVPLELEVDSDDTSAQHWLAESNDGQSIGCVRLVSTAGGSGKIGRLAVVKEWRSRGIAQQLMATTENYARKSGLGRLKLDAQLQAQGFYEKLGYCAEGDIFDDAGIPHRRMVKALRL